MKDYLVFDADGLLSVGCMVCGKKVAGRNREGRLVHYTHSKRKRVELEDGTYADLIVCSKCQPDASEVVLVEAMKAGWMEELRWKIERHKDHPEKDKIFSRYGMKPGDQNPSLSFYKKLFGGKRIKERNK